MTEQKITSKKDINDYLNDFILFLMVSLVLYLSFASNIWIGLFTLTIIIVVIAKSIKETKERAKLVDVESSVIVVALFRLMGIFVLAFCGSGFYVSQYAPQMSGFARFYMTEDILYDTISQDGVSWSTFHIVAMVGWLITLLVWPKQRKNERTPSSKLKLKSTAVQSSKQSEH